MSPSTAAVASPPKLLDRVRWHLRVKHYSIRTEEAYVDWIRRFILFHGKRHPSEMGEEQIREFLTHLAVERRVAASTQNQAFAALLFLYQQVLEQKLGFIESVERVSQPAKLPVVFTRQEARAVLAHLNGDYRLMAELLYGSGLRLMECLRLRIKDVDFGYNRINVRDGKGLRERVALLPQRLRRPLHAHIEPVKELHRQDLARGGGKVYLPFALKRNIRMRNGRGFGNTFFQQQNHRSTRVQAKCGGTTFRRRTCRMPSNSLSTRPASPKPPVAILSGTVLLHIYWKTGTIFAPYKNSWATKTCPRP